MNEEIPVISIGKQSKNDNTIEYNINNKFITGFGKEDLKDHPEKIYFRNIEFQEKKFLVFSKKEDINKYKRVYYYCKNHRTTKGNDQIDKNGKKKRSNICNAKIKYDIMEIKYSYFGTHTEECENLDRTLEINYAEVKKEIEN